MSDQFIPRDPHQNWLQYYSVQPSDFLQAAQDVGKQSGSKKFGWSGLDTVDSAKDPTVPNVFRTDVIRGAPPASSSGAVIIGEDREGNLVYADPALLPFWIEQLSKDRLVEPAAGSNPAEKLKQKEASSKEALTPLQAALAVARRVIYAPFRRLGRWLGRQARQWLLSPLIRTAQSLKEPLLKGVKALGRGAKKVLDTLILKAPQAAVSGLRAIGQRLVDALSAFASWLRW